MASKFQTAGYAGILAVCTVVGIAAGWTALAVRIDNYAYDVMSRAEPPAATPDSVVVAIDESTLRARGGMRNIRRILVEVLDKLSEARPRLVASDVILADDVDPALDAQLEAALRATPNLLLPSELDQNGQWEDPARRFRPLAVAIGHVHPEVDRLDGVSRQIMIERTAAGQRRWALSLEAFRVARGESIVESPEDVQVGSVMIPAPRIAGGRPMRIRYRPAGLVPRVSALEIDKGRDQIRGKSVFLGVTALSAANDRLLSPLGDNLAGVEIHAQAYETMRAAKFLTSASDSLLVVLCAGLAAAAGLIFWLLSGWPAYGSALLLLGVAHYLPLQFFRHDVVVPYFAPVAVAWLASVGAASYQHFVVRRHLRHAESERSRYQQAIHWAAHEMRTPLTSIQGSSEIMARYNLPEEKRHQLNEMINSESKRLARIIQTFLDMERLAEGQMELKQEPFLAADFVDVCMKRAAPLAARKQIALILDNAVTGTLLGDRELMEYAFYNLLTNAVKYSPQGTEVHVDSREDDGEVHLAVRDQGIGMDAKEIKNIFTKFYRTKSAEASGEVGTGIGLSIVEQIVARHGGKIDVASTPGKGSCFTMILTAYSAAPDDAKAADRRR